MKLRDANLQTYKKNYFTHPPWCILLSFSQNASRLLLPKRLWKCARTISFRKYKRKVVLKFTCRPQPATFLKTRLWHRCFSVNFVKFLRTSFSIQHLQWLLLNFKGKHQWWSLFLTNLQTFRSATLLKRDSNADVFLWNLRNF